MELVRCFTTVGTSQPCVTQMPGWRLGCLLLGSRCTRLLACCCRSLGTSRWAVCKAHVCAACKFIHASRAYHSVTTQQDRCGLRGSRTQSIHRCRVCGVLPCALMHAALLPAQLMQLNLSKWHGHFGTLMPFYRAWSTLPAPGRPLPEPQQLPVGKTSPAPQ